MKTIKITEETHYQIVDLQTLLYEKTKIRYSFNDVISIAIIDYFVTHYSIKKENYEHK